MDSLDNNPEFKNTEKQFKEWQNKNLRLQSDIVELKKKTFNLDISGHKTLSSKGSEIRIAKEVKKILVYYNITGCIFTPQEIFLSFYDPDGKLVKSNRWGKKLASYNKIIDSPISDTFEFPVNVRLSGDYKIVFSTINNRELDSETITLYTE